MTVVDRDGRVRCRSVMRVVFLQNRLSVFGLIVDGQFLWLDGERVCNG